MHGLIDIIRLADSISWFVQRIERPLRVRRGVLWILKLSPTGDPVDLLKI